MCVIVYKPPEKTVSRKQLLNCWKSNYDGAGFMWSDGNSLFINKGFFRFRKFYRSFRMVERANLKSAFVIHFRKVSSGNISVENCHPFYFKDKRFGFAHNGTLLDWIKKEEKDKSDSLNFTTGLLEQLPVNFDESIGIRFLLGRYAKNHTSKFIFMASSGEIIIPNKHQWEEAGGIFFSNNSYKGIKTAVKSLGFGRQWEDEQDFTSLKKDMWISCSGCKIYFKREFLTSINEEKLCFSCKRDKITEKNKIVVHSQPRFPL